MRRCGWRSKTPAPIIPAMMWTRPIWNAETPVNIAARRTWPVNSRARGNVHRRFGVPDGPRPHHGGDDGGRGLRTPSAPAHRLWRERGRLDPLCAAPDGFRV